MMNYCNVSSTIYYIITTLTTLPFKWSISVAKLPIVSLIKPPTRQTIITITHDKQATVSHESGLAK
jgi:hypothetical protein